MEDTMTLRIYGDAIEMVKAAYEAAKVIERSDADLARQLRRSSSSVPLNLAEGSYALKGNRKARYFTALGSANEVRSTLQVASAVGLLPPDTALDDRLDKIVATLWNLTR
jgi:four helix bundle protein